VHDADQLAHAAHRPLGEILHQLRIHLAQVGEIAREQLLPERTVRRFELGDETADAAIERGRQWSFDEAVDAAIAASDRIAGEAAA